MNYKGFILRKAFHVGSDLKVSDEGMVLPRKPKKDEGYWEVIDPMIGPDSVWTSFDTVKECKGYLDQLLLNIGMVSNKPLEWAKL